MVILALVPLDISASSQTVRQFHRAVVPDLQPSGQVPNPGTGSMRQAHDGQHQLVLGGFQPMPASRQLAEVKEPADVMAEIRQGFVVLPCKRLHI